jgi:hypothetical protein
MGRKRDREALRRDRQNVGIITRIGHRCVLSFLCARLPMKPLNKEAQASAEVVEGWARTKENIGQSHTPPAQHGHAVSQGLAGVCHASI